MSERPPLSGNVLLVAFEGWTDAGNSASGALQFIRSLGAYTSVYEVDSDAFLDYQFTRPTIENLPDGTRGIVYPSVTLYREDGERGDGSKLHILVGAEPARAWKQFTRDLMEAIAALEVNAIIFLGALLADAPHTRPIAVQALSTDKDICEHYDMEPSDYEGPVGYLTVLATAAETAGIPCLTIWASVPHYAHGSPSPKAASALIKKLEQLTGAEIAHDDLDLEATIWESTLTSLAEDDTDLHGYIQQLEAARDTEDPPSASGDSIAAEIEKYLRRKDDRRGSTGSAID